MSRTKTIRHITKGAAVLLVLTLLLGMTCALADESDRVEDLDPSKQCSLTALLVYKNEADESVEVPGASVKLYKVADLKTEGGSAIYTSVPELASLGIDYEGMTASASITAAEQLEPACESNGVTALTGTSGSDGKVPFTGLTPGMYLLVQDGKVEVDGVYVHFWPTLIMCPLPEWNEEKGINEWLYDVEAIPKLDPELTPTPTPPSTPTPTPTTTPPPTPKTGDESHPALWMLLAAMTLTGLAVLAVGRKGKASGK